MLKKLLLTATMLLATSHAFADSVRGYTKKDGTYVQGYERSSPNTYRYDNYGSKSNGGYQRDEYSSGFGATNRKNPSWGSYDNDNDSIRNSYDPTPGR